MLTASLIIALVAGYVAMWHFYWRKKPVAQVANTLRYYIIAGNHQQYDYWLRANVPPEARKSFRYVGTPDSLRGLNRENAIVGLYGTYYERKDFYDIEDVYLSCGYTVKRLT